MLNSDEALLLSLISEKNGKMGYRSLDIHVQIRGWNNEKSVFDVTMQLIKDGYIETGKSSDGKGFIYWIAESGTKELDANRSV